MSNDVTEPAVRAEPGERPTLPLSDLRSSGILWAVNRVLFHPRGFALALGYPDIGEQALDRIEAGVIQPRGFVLLGDGTETWRYGDSVPEDDAMRRFEAFLDQHRPKDER